MFNRKKIEHLERGADRLEERIAIELGSLKKRIKVLEKKNKEMFEGEQKMPTDFLFPFSTITFPTGGLWDKLLDYLGIEYFKEEEKSGFRSVHKKRGHYKKQAKK